MIRPANELPAEKREHMRGGDGTVTLTPALQPGDTAAKLRLFSRITLPAGASIGYHVHEGEEELFYFLSGTAEFNDNGVTHTVHAGDATVTGSGQGHSVRNLGEEPVEILAVIATL
ncbi:MAG TPA: cupin domain-containing protein [Firmicutes bacterium]|nr:cupin domain-containing protein [Bacillota bacterium]